MAELGPRTLKAIADGPTGNEWESENRFELFARRVALIAVEEARERCATACDRIAADEKKRE